MTPSNDTLWYDYETETSEAPRSRIGAFLQLVYLSAVILVTYLAIWA